MLAALQQFSRRRWIMAVVGALGTALVVGLPTDVIPNPVFGRPVPVTWWSYPVLALTAVLGGLLLATYVREPAETESEPVDPVGLQADEQRDARRGGIAGLMSFFAVGCPVCNKLVVVALGTVGAREWFEPVQPYLAALSIVLMAWAVRSRLRNADACALPPAAARAAANAS